MKWGSVRWVLLYDRHCGACSALADQVAAIAGSRLEVRDLRDQEVAGYRRRAFAGSPPWAPTLLRIGSDSVKGWSGSGLGRRLVLRLGPVRAWKIASVLGQLRGADTGRRRVLKALTGGLFGVAMGLGAVGFGGSHRDRLGLESGVAARVRSTRPAGTAYPVLVRAQARVDSLARDGGGRSFGREAFEWDKAELVEYEGGATALVVPVVGSLQADLERRFLFLGYDAVEEEAVGGLLITVRRRSVEDIDSYTVDFGTLDGRPIVGFEVDEQARQMMKVIHDFREADEPLVLAMDNQPLAYHNYWHCVGLCLRDDWDKLPWYMRLACGGSCNGCVFAGAWWGCAICVGCLGGYAAHCLFSHC